MSGSDWILDVCRDLQVYATQNYLDDVAEALELTIETARREIAQSKCEQQDGMLSVAVATTDADYGNVIPFAAYKSICGT